MNSVQCTADQQPMPVPAKSGQIENPTKEVLQMGKNPSFIILKTVGWDTIKSRGVVAHANTWCKEKITLPFSFFLLLVKWLCAHFPCVQDARKHCPLDLGLSCQRLACDHIENGCCVQSYPGQNNLAGTMAPQVVGLGVLWLNDGFALNLTAFSTGAILPSQWCSLAFQV